MTRRSDQLNRIEASVARLEEALAGHATHLRDQASATRIEVADARSSAEAAHAGVQALADMLPLASPLNEAIPPAAPGPPPAVRPAAGGGAEGEPAAAARRAPKTPKTKGM